MQLLEKLRHEFPLRSFAVRVVPRMGAAGRADGATHYEGFGRNTGRARRAAQGVA